MIVWNRPRWVNLRCWMNGNICVWGWVIKRKFASVKAKQSYGIQRKIMYTYLEPRSSQLYHRVKHRPHGRIFNGWFFPWFLYCISCVTWFCWVYMNNTKPVSFLYIYCEKYVFEWYSCQLFWKTRTFEIAFFVQVGLCRISINCLQTSELQNDNQMKTIVIFGMDRNFNIIVTRN